MYGPILSVLLMGLVPVWGIADRESAGLHTIAVAPPVETGVDRRVLLSMARRLSASGVLIADLRSGQTLYARDANLPRPMASLTKLMTALLIVEHHELGELVTVPEDIADVSGNVARLPAGDQFTVGDLLSALLITSANDAAITLAGHHSGSLVAFVEEMNARAQSLGLRQTSFANPTGLDADLQRSTPQELAWLTMYVLRRPAIAERLSRRGAQIRSLGGKTIYLTHTHALLHAQTPVWAGKTGTTDAAGQCLLSVVREQGREYIVILLRSSDRYADMRLVLDGLGG